MIWWLGFVWWFGGGDYDVLVWWFGFCAEIAGFWFGFGWACWFAGSALGGSFGLRVSAHTLVLFEFGLVALLGLLCCGLLVGVLG